jgi:ketosteroid isomerase-like protein
MAEHPNAELLRAGYEAFQKGDLDTVRSLFAENIVWHTPGRNHLAGDYRGVDATIGLFMKNFEETKGTFRVDVHDILGSEDHAVALASFSGEREGKSITDNYVHVVHIGGGLMTESWIFGANQEAVDDFWG